MKTIIIITLALLSLTSCKRWQMPDSDNKYLKVLKRDGNLIKTKARIANDLRVDAANQDTMTSSVSNGKATITTTIREGVTVKEGSKGKIVEEEGNYYFVFKDKEYRKKVGRLPLNVEKDAIFIRTVNLKMTGTNLVIDNNDPGFELRIKENERTVSINATN
jgi:hypothetical protein